MTGLLAAGRQAAEARMSDTCTVTRRSGTPTFDPADGSYTSSTTTVYTGKCRVRVGSVAPTGLPTAGQEVTTNDAIVSLPITATDVRVGDTLTIVTAAYDAELPDTVYTVHGVHAESQATARRLLCERSEVSNP